jgi:hypothetical protein
MKMKLEFCSEMSVLTSSLLGAITQKTII